MLGKIFQGIGNFAKNLIPGLINSKVTGVPTPQTRTGTEVGADYKGFLDTAYPGTTPWEQLGASSPMGAIQSGENSVKHQVKMQERELFNRSALQTQTLDNQSQVADQTNRAHIITSLGAVSPKAALQGLNLLNRQSKQVDPWDTQTQQHSQILPSQIKKTEAEGEKIKNQVPRENVLGLASQGFNKIIDKTGSFLGDKLGKFDSVTANLKSNIRQMAEQTTYNRGSKPRRFK